MSDESKVKIDDLFAAESKTIRRIFGVDSTGFYVPAYQRDYSWDSEKVERLLDDVLFGTYNTLDNHKSITFLGTIIVVETSNDNDQKITRGTSPEAILGIVDGQQRLTTLLMLIVALHSELRTYNVDDLPESMKKNVNRFLGALEKLYLMDISNEYDESDNNIHVLYPKIIRSCDVWSDSDKTHLKAFYGSPISQFIWQYIQFSKDSTTSRQIFDYDPKSDPDSVAHTNFRSTFE
ncbi:MAG: DUF262 domain-containing protein, partial [Proteobacteria bacterium]|nr:DUF262 domain-containing protein [Pseudomonadota bacterium]